MDVVSNIYNDDWYMDVFRSQCLFHALLLGGVCITVGMFETAKRRPDMFRANSRGPGGEHE